MTRIRKRWWAPTALLLFVSWGLIAPSAQRSSKPASAPPPRISAHKAPPLIPPTQPSRAAPQLAKAASASTVSPSERVASLRYGDGDDQLGRQEPFEANPEGVASLALRRDQGIMLLDKVNHRILTLDKDGNRVGSTPLKLRAPQELVVQADNSFLVMDRLVDKRIQRFDASGQPLGQIPIEGEGIEHAGSVTGLFADNSGIYVEHEHGAVVRIADAQGVAAPTRLTLSGRPSQDGKSLVSAHLSSRSEGAVYLRRVDRETQVLHRQRRVSFDASVLAIEFLETDRSGNIYLGVQLSAQSSPTDPVDTSIKVVCLDPELSYQGQVDVPAQALADESFRDFSVNEQGDLFYVHRLTDRVTIEKYRCG